MIVALTKAVQIAQTKWNTYSIAFVGHTYKLSVHLVEPTSQFCMNTSVHQRVGHFAELAQLIDCM